MINISSAMRLFEFLIRGFADHKGDHEAAGRALYAPI